MVNSIKDKNDYPWSYSKDFFILKRKVETYDYTN